MQPLGGGVDGGEVILHRRGIGLEQAVLGVVDLEPGGAGAGLAEAAHPAAGLELLLLGRREVEEAQAEDAAAVLEAHQQAAPPAAHHLGGHHLALHHRLVAGAQGADGGDAGAVLVAQGEVEEQVGDGGDAQPGQLRRQRLADALERVDRGVERVHAGARSAWWQRATASVMASIALGRGKLARQAMATVRRGAGSAKGTLASRPLS